MYLYFLKRKYVVFLKSENFFSILNWGGTSHLNVAYITFFSIYAINAVS